MSENFWLGQGHYVSKFENKLSRFINSRYGVSTTSGTTALHLACATIGLKEVMRY